MARRIPLPCCATYFGPGSRIGEAANSGPHSGFDDSDGVAWKQLGWDDSEPANSQCGLFGEVVDALAADDAGDLAEESSSRKERRLLRRFRFTSNFQFFRKADDADRVAAETRVRSRLWRWRRAASKGKAKRVIRAGESYGMGL